jgi:hypothetical protein
MIRLSTIFISILLSLTAGAQDSVSVLFIGNSYTYVNDLPNLLTQIASSLGDVVYQDSHTPGGTTFQNHAGNPAAYAKINSEPWDYVVLQGQSQEPSFSDSQVDAETLPYAVQLADSVYANRFCSEVLFYMTWGRENGDPQWGPISTFEGMNMRLRNAYLRMSDSVQGSVAPVGVAWKYVRDNYPTIGLYAGDGSHPSLEGSYLAACTFYASVFRKSPIGAPFISTLDPTTAGILQAAASLNVLDSLDQWNLRPPSEHTQAEFISSGSANVIDFTNLSTKATTYDWDFGDGMTSTDEHPSYVYTALGNYTVTLIAGSPCDLDTIQNSVDVNNLGTAELASDFKLASLGNGVYQIESPEEVHEMHIYSSTGKELRMESNLNKLIEVNLLGFARGVYMIVLETASGNHSIRILN